jgi:SAM-dependent methyltransferase
MGHREYTSVAKLPLPDFYEREYTYWPWGTLLARVAVLVAIHAPQGSHIVDYMCGTGFLLNLIHTRRPDLTLEGCDINPSYVEFAQQHYPAANFVLADARDFKPSMPPALVLCTAGLHHLSRSEQPRFLAKIARELPSGACLLLGEELIESYKGEAERRRAVINMCTALLRYIVDRDAPLEVLESATDVLCNDLPERGEYKISRGDLEALLCTHFRIENFEHIWPDEPVPFGDVLLLCRNQ